MHTYRRLNEGARYWGMTWQAWACAAAGGALLYAVVRLSPLPTKPTISLTLIVLAAVGCVLWAISGQSISPAGYLAAWWRWRFGPSLYVTPGDAAEVTRGIVVDAVPPQLVDVAGDGASVGEDHVFEESHAW
jgi:hypothetical protein